MKHLELHLKLPHKAINPALASVLFHNYSPCVCVLQIFGSSLPEPGRTLQGL